MEDEYILKDQTFELIYAQSRYMHTIFLQVLQPTIEPTPNTSHVADGPIVSLQGQCSEPTSKKYQTRYIAPTTSPIFRLT